MREEADRIALLTRHNVNRAVLAIELERIRIESGCQHRQFRARKVWYGLDPLQALAYAAPLLNLIRQHCRRVFFVVFVGREILIRQPQHLAFDLDTPRHIRRRTFNRSIRVFPLPAPAIPGKPPDRINVHEAITEPAHESFRVAQVGERQPCQLDQIPFRQIADQRRPRIRHLLRTLNGLQNRIMPAHDAPPLRFAESRQSNDFSLQSKAVSAIQFLGIVQPLQVKPLMLRQASAVFLFWGRSPAKRCGTRSKKALQINARIFPAPKCYALEIPSDFHNPRERHRLYKLLI